MHGCQCVVSGEIILTSRCCYLVFGQGRVQIFNANVKQMQYVMNEGKFLRACGARLRKELMSSLL